MSMVFVDICPPPPPLSPSSHLPCVLCTSCREQADSPGGASLCLQFFHLLDSILEPCTPVGTWGPTEAPPLSHIHGPFSDTLDWLLGGLLCCIFHQLFGRSSHIHRSQPASSHLVWKNGMKSPKGRHQNSAGVPGLALEPGNVEVYM